MKSQNTQLKTADPRIILTSNRVLVVPNTYHAAALVFFFTGVALLIPSVASATTITVINNNDSGPGSLRQALSAANDGDTIDFDSSLNGQRIILTSGQLNVDKDVIIRGPGAKNLAVDGNAHSRVFYVNSGKTVSIDGLTVANGYSPFSGGGGIYNDAAASLTVTNCTFSANSTYYYGGGIYNDAAALTVTNCMLNGNWAYSGGGICSYAFNGSATLTVSNCSISGNLTGFGGGISNGAYNHAATLTVTDCTISDNSGGKGGGGIFNYAPGGDATLMITNSTISRNSGYPGGGIFSGAGSANIATLTITNGTISDNSGSDGGGIYNEAFPGGVMLTIINSTLSGNSARDGGGVFNYASGHGATLTLTITNSTLSGNSADVGGGGISNQAYDSSVAEIETGDTIFNAGSSGRNIYNVAGTVTSLGYNLSSDNGGGYLTGSGDQINTDPLLGPLQYNGGPTYTHALSPGSPAIGAGNPNFTPPPFYDQRGPGFYRVVNNRIDIGSFEVQLPRNTPTPKPRPTPAPRP